MQKSQTLNPYVRAKNLLIRRAIICDAREVLDNHYGDPCVVNRFTVKRDPGAPQPSWDNATYLNQVFESVRPWLADLLDPVCDYLQKQALKILTDAQGNESKSTEEVNRQLTQLHASIDKGRCSYFDAKKSIVYALRDLHVVCINGSTFKPLTKEEEDATNRRLEGYDGVETLNWGNLIKELLLIHALAPRATEDGSRGRQSPGQAGSSVRTSSNSPRNGSRSRSHSRHGSSSVVGRSGSSDGYKNPFLFHLPQRGPPSRSQSESQARVVRQN